MGWRSLLALILLAGCGRDAGAPLDPALASCAVCHGYATGAAGREGPNLAGVVGRPAASAAGFRYSPALAGSRLVWDRAALDRYLADPQAVVPGGRMTVRVTDSERRAAIIDALARTAR